MSLACFYCVDEGDGRSKDNELSQAADYCLAHVIVAVSFFFHVRALKLHADADLN